MIRNFQEIINQPFDDTAAQQLRVNEQKMKEEKEDDDEETRKILC
jgi:hypothetical protein